jgi:hypothetical protein
MIHPEDTSNFAPGTIIQLGGIARLAAFEDIVADRVDPNMTQSMRDAWAGRTVIKDMLRPPKFNGTITDIHLVVMEEPFERWLDARERGLQFYQGVSTRSDGRKTLNEEIINSVVGLNFVANARSSVKGSVGQIQAELYYRQVDRRNRIERNTLKDGSVKEYSRSRKQVTGYGGASIYRVITKPKLETTALIELPESAVRVKFGVLQ